MARNPNRFTHSGMEKIGDQSTSGTTLIDAQGLAIDVDAFEEISFRFMVLFQVTSAIASIKLDLLAPASPVVFAYDIQLPDSVTSMIRAINQAAIGTIVPAANTPLIAWIWGHLKNGANNGSVKVQFASTSGLSTATVMDNSSVIMWDIYP